MPHTAQPPAMQIALVPAASLVAAPWKNGGGVTREIAAYPPGAALDAFVWRVSVADVAQAGPFSRFAGIDRTLVLLSGAGMLLDETGDAGDIGDAQLHTHALTKPFDSARFTGEANIDARLVDGATRDFNLMARRGAASGEIDVWRDAGTHTVTADTLLLFCAAGSLSVTPGAATPVELATGDTLRIDHAQALHCVCEGMGTVLAVRLELRRPSQASATSPGITST
ncbi:HutD family protein [Paraburkholderia jirisanensis]